MLAMILEVEDHQAGVLLREQGGFVLYTALPRLAPLEQRRFRSVRAAASAVRRLMAAGGRDATR